MEGRRGKGGGLRACGGIVVEEYRKGGEGGRGITCGQVEAAYTHKSAVIGLFPIPLNSPAGE